MRPGMITEKCSKCGRDHYPNDLAPIQVVGEGKQYKLCRSCSSALLSRLSDKYFVGMMIKTTLPHGEAVRVSRERAKIGACNKGKGFCHAGVEA